MNLATNQEYAHNSNNRNNRNLIAVLRHITPQEVEAVCDVLVEGGITMMEVTVNSANYEESLSKVIKRYSSPVQIGAGTVITVEELYSVHKIGVSFIVSPNPNPVIISQSKKLGLQSIPGVFTPHEAITALQAGADALKFFPASWAPPTAVKDLKALLSSKTMIYAVGGVGPKNFSMLLQAGFDGFGIGNSLFHKGISLKELKKNCQEIVSAYDQAVLNQKNH